MILQKNDIPNFKKTLREIVQSLFSFLDLLKAFLFRRWKKVPGLDP